MFRIKRSGILGISLAVILLLFCGLVVKGQEDKSPAYLQLEDIDLNHFGLFDETELLELSLRFDLNYYLNNKPEEEYLDALLTYHFNDRDSISKIVKLRARGNFRYRNCDFPPLRLNLKKNSFSYSDLDAIENIKLVTHCKDSIIYDSYLMREYLAYRIYNLISPYSFRVRLLKIKYADIADSQLVMDKYAFAIEPMSFLQARTNTTEIEEDNIPLYSVDPDMAVRVAFFQFLIGNADFFIGIGHNIKGLDRQEPDDEHFYPVPYDFDYSGFVNTYYATPVASGENATVTTRKFIGACPTDDQYRKIREDFLEYKDAIIEEVRNFKYLDRKYRRELIAYIESFYDLYKNDALLELINKSCISK